MAAWDVSPLTEARARVLSILERRFPEHRALFDEAARRIVRPVVVAQEWELEEGDPEPRLGASRVCGRPDLGRHAWPTRDGVPMLFLAQFDLAEARPHDEDRLLPPEGLLSLFVTEDALQDMESDEVVVLFEPDPGRLRPAPAMPGEPPAMPPGPLTFRADLHPYGDLRVTNADGTWTSLHYDDAGVVHDPEWSSVTSGADHASLFLLGSPAVLFYGEDPERDDEVTLLGFQHVGSLDIVNIMGGYVVLIPEADLARADFSRVRLAGFFAD